MVSYPPICVASESNGATPVSLRPSVPEIWPSQALQWKQWEVKLPVWWPKISMCKMFRSTFWSILSRLVKISSGIFLDLGDH